MAQTNERTVIGITTYGAAAYVDLSLTMHRSWEADVIVCDDGSASPVLHDVCQRHRVPLIGVCRTRERIPGFGDLIATTELIRYAAAHGFEFAIKQSRRWICLEDPRPSLESLADVSGGNTFSNITTSFRFGFRTEFTGYRVADWMPVLPTIYAQVQSGREVFVEAYIHRLARSIEPQTEQYRQYISSAGEYPADQTGYVHWTWMGDDRRRPPTSVMWHDFQNSADYYLKSRELGLPWSFTDFKEFNK